MLLLVLLCLFDPERGNSLCYHSMLRSVSDTGEVKLEWQKDNFGRSEFMAEMLSV